MGRPARCGITHSEREPAADVQTRLPAHSGATARPVGVGHIAEAVRLPVELVEGSLRPWPLVLWDAQQRVVGFWEVHAEQMFPTHPIEVDGATAYAWCAWDTLFITEILGCPTQVTSTDPENGDTVQLGVTPVGVISVDPGGAVSLLLPDEGLSDDALQRFCHKVHFFTSPEPAEAWIERRSSLLHITIDEAFELGRFTNRLRMSTVLDDPDVDQR